MKNSSLIIALSGAGLMAAATAASAEIICNDEGDCWHVKERYEYKPEFKLQIYKDDWKWEKEKESKYRWREHDGRGYWSKGVWIEF